MDVGSYHYTIDGHRALSLIAQLGCPFECGFCGGRSPNCPVCGVRPGDPDGGPARPAGPSGLDAASGLAAEERPEDVLLRDALTLLLSSPEFQRR